MKIDNFFAELKRRNVYKVAVAYAIVGWLLVQVATQVFPFFEIPNWAVRLIVLAIVIGFPIALERAKADVVLRELEQLAKRQYVSPTAFATIYLGLGQKEKCLDWLEKSYEQQDSACWYLKIDQIYDSVRNEPRFQALVQKVFGSNL